MSSGKAYNREKESDEILTNVLKDLEDSFKRKGINFSNIDVKFKNGHIGITISL